MAEEQNLAAGQAGDALKGGKRAVLVQVFVDLTWAAMDEEETRPMILQANLDRELLKERLVLGGCRLAGPQQRALSQRASPGCL